MGDNKGKRIIELIKKREKLEGTRIFRMLSHLAASLYAVNRNYQELSTAIDKYEGDLTMWDIKKRPQFDAFLRELLRLLQNYLSSVYSLIQHTSILRSALNHSELNRDYTLKLKTLQSNNCARFVRDLRTYSQHIRLPIISARLSITHNQETGSQKVEQKILLEKKELIKWKNWHKDSVKYINSHKDINLKVVLNEYQTLNKAFYDWFYKKVGKLYSKELQEFIRIDSEIARLS